VQVVIQPDWDLLAAIDAAYSAYVGSGKSSKGYRMSVLMTWANVVGKRRAIHDFEGQVASHGSKKAFAEWLGVGPATLRKVEQYFERVPGHEAISGRRGTPDLLDQLSYSRRIGSGAFGEVWRGTDPLGRDVAVKFMLRSKEDEISAMEHARALGPVCAHENIVTVYYCAYLRTPDGATSRPGIVMEYVEGRTLQRCLSEGLSVDEARRIGTGVSGAISYIHDFNMVHGDLHEANVIVRENGTPILIDLVNDSSFASYLGDGSEARRTDDAAALVTMLRDLLRAAGGTPQRVTTGSSVNEARLAFLAALEETETAGASESATVAGRQFLEIWIELERIVLERGGPINRRPVASVALADLVRRDVVKQPLAQEFLRLRDLRNQFVHQDPSVVGKAHVEAARKLLRSFKRSLQSVDQPMSV
jgi:hypothetical protein